MKCYIPDQINDLKHFFLARVKVGRICVLGCCEVKLLLFLPDN